MTIDWQGSIFTPAGLFVLFIRILQNSMNPALLSVRRRDFPAIAKVIRLVVEYVSYFSERMLENKLNVGTLNSMDSQGYSAAEIVNRIAANKE